MKCRECGDYMTQLLTSWACDACERRKTTRDRINKAQIEANKQKSQKKKRLGERLESGLEKIYTITWANSDTCSANMNWFFSKKEALEWAKVRGDHPDDDSDMQLYVGFREKGWKIKRDYVRASAFSQAHVVMHFVSDTGSKIFPIEVWPDYIPR